MNIPSLTLSFQCWYNVCLFLLTWLTVTIQQGRGKRPYFVHFNPKNSLRACPCAGFHELLFRQTGMLRYSYTLRFWIRDILVPSPCGRGKDRPKWQSCHFVTLFLRQTGLKSGCFQSPSNVVNSYGRTSQKVSMR